MRICARPLRASTWREKTNRNSESLPMLVRAEVSVVSATAASAGRSRNDTSECQ